MDIYEVNLRVDNDAAEEAAAWLPTHIAAVLGVGGFEGATWFFQEPDGDQQLWTVQYHVTSWRLLERYIQTKAREMRAEAAERFGGRIQAERRFLFEREQFSPAE